MISILPPETEFAAPVGKVIGELVDLCAPARVELVTGMADGADQIVTQVAIEQGCDVHVVLPKPYDTYRTKLSPQGRPNSTESSPLPGSASPPSAPG